MPSRPPPSPRPSRRPASHSSDRPHREEVAAARERMGRVDTAWLRMDSEANRMVIAGVWVLQPGISHAALRQRLQERLLRYPRFVQRVVEDAGGAVWVDDEAFDIDRHLLVERLERHRTDQEAQQVLQRRLAELIAKPLDPRRPLWQFHLVEHYRGGSALLIRIHHCIADGIALISVMQSVTDGGVVPPVRKALSSPAAPAFGSEAWLAETIIRPLTGLTVKAVTLAGDQAARSAGFWMHPQRGLAEGLQSSVDVAHLAVQIASDMAALALMPDDSPSPLKGEPLGVKRVAWCPPLPLDEVKVVSKALCCSINDVLLSCVAGALGAYLRTQGVATEGLELRAMVPINLRPLEQAHQLGNHFGLIPVVLPVGIENPIERLFEVRARMQSLKGSTQPLMSYGMLGVAGLLVKPAQDALLGLFSRKTTAVMTNVPGPREKLALCGSTIEESLFWVPQTGTVGLGVSILSYGGGVQFGVVSDARLCPQPQSIIDGFAPEFERLTTLTLMLPWGDSDEGL